MARVVLHIEDDSGNEVHFEQGTLVRPPKDSPDAQVDELLKAVYAKARKIYPEKKEEND